jgi:hypothetical protein
MQGVASIRAHFEATELFASKSMLDYFLTKASFAKTFKTQFIDCSSIQLEVKKPEAN